MGHLRQAAAAFLASLTFGGAQAALVGFGLDSNSDAGPTLGSTDTFVAAAAGLNTVNGTTGTFFLEELNPGLEWGLAQLTLVSASDANRSGTAGASLFGLPGTLVSAVDNDPGNGSLLLGWTYVFSFAGTLQGNSLPTLTLTGFGSGLGQDRVAGASLVVTAVPEPSALALALAGLGACAVAATRRRSSPLQAR